MLECDHIHIYMLSKAGYNNKYIALADKARFLKAEMIEGMLYGCVTWTLSPNGMGTLRKTHHRELLLRQCQRVHVHTHRPEYDMLSYHEDLNRTSCECIEATDIRRPRHAHCTRTASAAKIPFLSV